MRLTAAELAAERDRLWQQLQPTLARTPALANQLGKPLRDIPIISIEDLRSNYGAWNSLGLSQSAIEALANASETGQTSGPLSAGWSTGTGGGQRGLFLTSETEREDYIGQSLARLLSPIDLIRGQRIALHLRAGNTLYSDVGRGHFKFKHFPLKLSATNAIHELIKFRPTILIAPPHRLIEFAKMELHLLSLRHLFYGSEPLSIAENSHLSHHFGHSPRSIYQATEGFLGAECSKGCLHLNDHSLDIELEPIPRTDGFRAIITDLRRISQPIIRVRMDDYLELSPLPCPCGYAGRVILPVQGRVKDIWAFEQHVITPPQVIAAIEHVLGGAEPWQARANPSGARLSVTSNCPPDRLDMAAQLLANTYGIAVTTDQTLQPWTGPKRSKVVWNN